MGKSRVAGSCVGADIDAKNIYKIVKEISTESLILINDGALRDTVLDYMKRVILDTDLTFIFYAGHGGSNRLKFYAPEEIDGNDEMIFSYDNPIIDDEIWNIIKTSDHPVFLMFDCCHSETMFRIAPPKALFSRSLYDPIDMLCWSGCADNKVSYGNKDGGEFTNTFLKYYSPGITYNELWKLLATDKKLQESEIIKSTELKTSDLSKFGDKIIFS